VFINSEVSTDSNTALFCPDVNISTGQNLISTVGTLAFEISHVLNIPESDAMRYNNCMNIKIIIFVIDVK